MTAAFPHPYTLDAAPAWLARSAAEPPIDHFAIEVDGVLASGAGIQRHGGEREGVAELGYWLGAAYRGRGVGTEAGRLLAVLQKSGFVREVSLAQAYVERDGTVVDGALYARLRDHAADNRCERLS